jgi:charged multivesicular body protein 4
LFALKKKKVYETQIEKLAGARMTIEIQIGHLEQITVTKEAIDAMKFGAEAMKSVHGDMYVNIRHLFVFC